MYMMKLTIQAMAAMLLIVATSVNADSVTSNEYQAVVSTAYKYFEGAANGDQALLAESFDMDFGDVKMVTVDKENQQEKIRTVPFKEFAEFFKTATKDTWKANVIAVDIVDNKMAMVKMDFITPKTHYVDYLVMYKRNDKWKIINKTFSAKKNVNP